MKKIKKLFLDNKIATLITIGLLAVIGMLVVQNQDYKYTLFYQYQAIPDISLENTLILRDAAIIPEGEISREQARMLLNNQNMETNVFGKVTGFVKFDDIKDQPKTARQYYVIEALNEFDQNGNQYFELEEFIKMNYLPLKSLGTTEVVEVRETSSTITLEDEDGNNFYIDKATMDVSMRDLRGNNVEFITNDSDFKEFMKDWLLN